MTDHPLAQIGETDESPPPSESRKLWLLSVEFWALVGGISALVTAITAVGAVLIGFAQLNEQRVLQREQSAYEGFAQLQALGVEHPELACPSNDAAFGALMSQPVSEARYGAFGELVINNSEQLLQMAPNDRRWEFLIRERMRCHAPAIRFLMRQGTFDRRYSCRLRQLIAEEMHTTRPTCPTEG